MVSLHSNRNLTKTEIGTRNWSIVVIGLTMLCLKEYGFRIRKAAEHFNCCLMGHTSRSTEENVSMWSCDILVKNVATFCPCLENLPGAKVKSSGLIPLVEKNLKTDLYALCHVVISSNSDGDL